MSSIKKQEDEIRTLLQKHIHTIISRENEAFVDILEIIMAQEKWLDKLDTIQSFRITRSRLNKAIILQVKVNKFPNWLNVSWRNGCDKKRKEEDPLQSAFRQAIYKQISNWKKINYSNVICSICNDTNHLHLKLQVDHKNPSFIKLTKDFLDKPDNKNIPVNFDYHKCGRKFKKEDYLFKKRWQNYHNKFATLQWLCRKCNLTKKKN